MADFPIVRSASADQGLAPMKSPAVLDQTEDRFGPREIQAFTGELRYGENEVVCRSGPEHFPADLRVKGTDNLVRIGRGCNLAGLRIYVRGRRQRLRIGNRCTLRGSIFLNGGADISVTIGEGTTFQHAKIYCSEGAGVHIGKDCMLSRDIEIRTSDAHGIYDATTRARINRAQPVRIGNNVWVGAGAMLSKGCSIPDGCVVGARSFVNHSFEEAGVVIAGVPARIVKRNIIWDRGREDRLPPVE